MPLSPPVAREPMHTRRIELNGFRREDGLWDIEAHLVDTKHYAFDSHFRGPMPPGEPVHDMWARMTVDEHLSIHGFEASTELSPFPSCPQAAPRYGVLVGLKIRSGWVMEARERLASVAGCTHLFELLPPMATAAFQTIAPLRQRRAADPDKRPQLLNSCHGWRADGEAVRLEYPRWYTGPES